ncbi:MAG: head GIN domain-containing protein [Bacteroidota bacterium]
MRTSLLLIAFVSIAFALQAQKKETRSLSSFHGVHTSASINTKLVKGAKNQVEIKVRGVDLEDVKSEVDGGILTLGMKDKQWGNMWKNKEVWALVTYTDELDYIGATSSSDMIVEETLSGSELSVKVTSSADMKVDIDVDELNIDISSSADLTISGQANKAKIDASSSADLSGKGLTVDHARLKASSSSDISIGVTQSLDAKASSSAEIVYYGQPEKRNIDRSSSGSVRGRN